MFFSGSVGRKQMSAPPPVKNANGSLAFDESLPKTEPCPLNGAKYSTQQRDWWEKHRPLLVMIENHENARPQSGISKADVTYEAVAEGGITRTMNVFYCQDGGQVGPVRSARTYFLDWASEYGDHPLYVHVGGANTDGPADALGQIDDYGWVNYNDMNQFSIGFPTFWRDYNRLGHETATEHTMYSTTDKLWDFAKKNRKLTTVDTEGTKWDTGFTPYTFKDDSAAATPDATTIHLEMWEGYKDYMIDWVYNKASNDYSRKNAGVAHMDKNTNKQLRAKTIVVMYMQESHANDGYENNAHLLYGNKGKGKAVVFMDGREIKANWSKNGRTGKTIITDAGTGKEIAFNRGKLWFEVLPLDGVLTAK
jgi:hypothetical protein